MPRGGRRTGKPGASYGNRTDLNGSGLHSKQYGDGAARAAATAAVPVAAPQAPPAAVQAAPAAPAGPVPGSFPDLLDPTARPDEPTTAGLPFGPGAGVEGMRQSGGDPDLDLLREIYRAHPSEALREIIEAAEEG